MLITKDSKTGMTESIGLTVSSGKIGKAKCILTAQYSNFVLSAVLFVLNMFTNSVNVNIPFISICICRGNQRKLCMSGTGLPSSHARNL